MTTQTNNLSDALAAKISSYDDQLSTTSHDIELLAEIEHGLSNLMASADGSADDVRALLRERLAAGTLREETFELVNSILDRQVSENIPTHPTGRVERATVPNIIEDTYSTDDQFGTTTVIPVSDGAGPVHDVSVQVGSVLRDRYLLQEKIDGGSMGVVYKALDRRLAEIGSNEQWVAIKVLSPQLAEDAHALRALQQEALKGRQLLHPNIVRFVDVDRDDELYFIVMEWLHGRTLADILDSEDRVSIDQVRAFDIVKHVGAALSYAHKHGIVHADIKPGNVMIAPNGDVKLFDFGVSRIQQEHLETRFDPGVLGALTPAYSSMQVLTGETPTPSDDVFSLAGLLYRLLAGYRVFGPRNAAEASQEGMSPQKLDSLSDSEWRTLKKALSFSRVARYETVADFMTALEQSRSELGPIEIPERIVADFDDSGSRVGWLTALLVVLCGVGAVGYYYGYFDTAIDRLRTAVESTNRNSDVVASGVSGDRITAVDQPEQALQATNNEIESSDVLPTGVETTEARSQVLRPVPLTSSEADVNSESIELDERASPPVGPSLNVIDFSQLPPANFEIPVVRNASRSDPVRITMREDSGPILVDFVRNDRLDRALTLRLEEIGFSGNQSPWASGQYDYSDRGILEFPAGQSRARIAFTMASDPMREADQQSMLRLRELDYADTDRAVVSILLEDDDQRAFENGLPVDTIAFAAGQASIRESDPAVQIDVVRFNPSDTPLSTRFVVSDITATEGEDYFAPGDSVIEFGPGQRSARLLIPLVHDAANEGDEAFVIELEQSSETVAVDIYRRIVVMIRDDET